MLAISCKKGNDGGNPETYFRITATDGQTALVRSALSTNQNSPAGTSNAQNIYVDITEATSQGFSVSVISAQTNNAGDIKDFVSFTNRGSRYFLVVNDEIFTNETGYLIKADSTTPLTVNYRVSATGSGYTGATSYDYKINGTLQFANIVDISTYIKKNDIGQLEGGTGNKLQFGFKNGAYTAESVTATNSQTGDRELISADFVGAFMATNKTDFDTYFQSVDLGSPAQTTENQITYTANFTPFYSNEMTNSSGYKIILDNDNNKLTLKE